MLSQKGFILGKMGYGSFIYSGDYSGHLLTMAAPGSGKGVGVVIPNLLRHRGSAIVLDPKGENYIVTAQQRRKLGNVVYYYDPWEVMGYYPGANLANTIKAKINKLPNKR
jgi:type IV secretory pathway TraG/TraD family ATPase VirD4